MYEGVISNRDGLLIEASETLQRLFTKGSLGSRIRDARKVLCSKPFEWTRNRVFDVFLGKDWVVVHGHEIDHLRYLRRQREIEEAKNEQQEIDVLRARLARLEAALTISDEAFHRPQIEALRGAPRGLGGMVDRSRDGGGE